MFLFYPNKPNKGATLKRTKILFTYCFIGIAIVPRNPVMDQDTSSWAQPKHVSMAVFVQKSLQPK